MNTRAHSTARIMLREAGTALAVLALYVLTMLLPLHQAAGLERDLDALGFSSLSTWSICQPADEHGHGEPRDAAALTCPAAGVAKHELAAILPPVLVIESRATGTVIRFAAERGAIAAIRPDHVGQSRAPPVAV